MKKFLPKLINKKLKTTKHNKIFFRVNNFYLQLARVYSLGLGFKLDLNCLGLVQIKICYFNNNLKVYTVKS